jgi:hypothetical protein
MSEPILPLRQWPAGIPQSSVPANDNALRLEALFRPCLGVANDETGSDVDGDVWLVGDTPAGAFSAFDENDIALCRVDGGGASWYAWAPVDELPLIVAGVRKVFDESTDAWIDDPSVAGGTGSGDVVGPASATADAVALYDGTTGKLLKDGQTIASIKRIEQNSQSTDYTLVLSDAGKHILHPSADTTARTFTIPANSSVAFPIGTAVTFVNQNSAGVATIAITTDEMRLAGAGTTGSRTLAANGVATALKITSTSWIISGVGLT